MISLIEASPDPSAGQLSFTLTRATNGMMYLFEARGRNWSFGVDSKERARLSLGREVWFCVLEEHTMFSECSFWRDGVEIWGICHDPDAGGVYHLEERGNLPEIYDEIRNARLKEQEMLRGEDAGIDVMISVPMDLCERMTSYGGGDDGPEGDYSQLYSPIIQPGPKVGMRLFLLMNTMAIFSRIKDIFRKK